MGGDELTALQVMDQQLVVLCAATDTGLLPSHGYRILVSLPGDQPGLVDLARFSCRHQVQQALRDQIGLELAALQRLEMLPRMLSGRAVHTRIGYGLKPVMQMLVNGVLVRKLLAIETVTLDVLDAGLHLALALRVIALTGMDTIASRGCILVEALVERQLSILLADHHHLGLVVNALLSDAAEVAEGLVMHLDKTLGIQRTEAQADIH